MLESGARRVYVVSANSGQFTPLYEAEGAPVSVGTGLENTVPPRSDSWALQPVGSRYTE
jgi:hypothetical protein